MRNRVRVLKSLESVYRGAFTAAEDADDGKAMEQLDLEYQRDQLQLEILLDIRDLLIPEKPDATSSLLEKAQNIRKLTKLR
ncbi:MAG: hypothetical protein VX507_07160 [Gemmatimonadota bacterium]|nr:hypothetical protein [Gemmatimonadota bacterium]